MISIDDVPCLRDVVSEEQPSNFDTPLLTNSKYYNIETFCEVAKNINNDTATIFNANARSLVKNFSAYKSLFHSFNDSCDFTFDVITFTETWANEDLEDLLYLEHYNCEFRHKPHRKEGGGLATFIRDTLKYKSRPDLHFPSQKQNEYDALFVEILPNSSDTKSTIIGNIYRSPAFNNIVEFTHELLALIEKLNSENKHIVINGDFNIDILKFNSNAPTACLLDMMLSHNMIPRITLPTRLTQSTATLIDHIYCNVHIDNLIAGTITTDISDHFSNFLFVPAVKKPPNPKFISYRIITEETIRSFNTELAITDFSKIYIDDPSEAYFEFLNIFTTLRDKHMPLVTKRFNKYKHKINPWITKGILKSLKTKDKLHSKLRKTKTEIQRERLKEKYSAYKMIYDTVVKRAKQLYWENKFDECRNDMKLTWQNLNNVLHRRKNKKDFPNQFNDDGQNISDPYEVANAFNKYYINVGPNLAQQIDPQDTIYDDNFSLPPTNLVNSFFLQPTTPTEVSSIVNLLKPKTSCGYDDISPKFIKQCSQSIIMPLTYIANLSFEKGIFPTNMKIAKVIPIFKANDPSIFKNYRPISLLPAFSKIFERLMYNRLYTYLSLHGILSPSQYGFQENRSTEQAILEMQDRIIQSLDRKLCCLGIFLDLSKAFDTLDHSILLNKLHHYGIRGISLNWFNSYLNDRSQFVSLGTINSDTEKIVCGVPQGSILGPLLFILYMNDLANIPDRPDMILFADDTNLLFTHKNFESLIHNVTSSLSLTANWFARNKLSLNTDKTHFVIFHRPRQYVLHQELNIRINGRQIQQVQNVKFLGVYLDSNMSWKTHLNKKASQIARVNGILCRLRYQLNITTMKLIYETLILPHLQYAITCWGNIKNTDMNRIKTLQKKSIRLITKSKYNSHTSPLFKQLKLLTLDDIFLINCCKIYHRYSKGILPNYFHHQLQCNRDIHSHTTRQHNLIHTRNISSELMKQTINYKISVCWNNLPAELKQNIILSIPIFTKKIKQYLLSKYLTNCYRLNCYVCERT